MAKLKSFLITACCGCQRVRTDDNQWGDGEDLLNIAPYGTITHTICPECLTKMYPDYAQAVLNSLESSI